MGRRFEKEGNERKSRKSFMKFYGNVPNYGNIIAIPHVKSRLGTSSGGKRSYGMGLVLTETLPLRALKELKRKTAKRSLYSLFVLLLKNVKGNIP